MLHPSNHRGDIGMEVVMDSRSFLFVTKGVCSCVDVVAR